VCSCPECGKPVFERKTRFGKIFYGCSAYPSCKFASWEKPTNLKCPKCKKFLTVRETKTNLTYKCSDKDCDFTKQEVRLPEKKD
ncbi:MAG: topoisomerase DNA-binding C4 zinc finger domain-containing protein, partial [Clostridia bacterium]|nr:topoisomerase DNA-binding C4 zinc finger domain-containing protein [Clostridia bacterium]